MKPKTGPSVRISDVARSAGVSPSTVSRVLAGSSHKVSKSTQEKVRRASADLGYRANPIARALRLSTTGAVGMVVPSIGNPFFTELVEQVERQLSSNKINLYLCNSHNDPAVEAARLKSLSTGMVDGILVVPVHQELSREAVAAAASAVPLVQLDRQVPGLHIPWVGVEDRTGIHDVMEHLQMRSVSSLAVLTNTQASLSSQVRTTEILAQANRWGMNLQDHHVLEATFTIDEGRAAIESLLARGPLPDAVVCIDDMLAIGALMGLQRHGIRVPDDVLVTGFDGIRYSAIVSPSLTTLRQPLERIAAEAVRLLTDPADLGVGIQVSLLGHLVVRGSTGA